MSRFIGRFVAEDGDEYTEVLTDPDFDALRRQQWPVFLCADEMTPENTCNSYRLHEWDATGLVCIRCGRCR